VHDPALRQAEVGEGVGPFEHLAVAGEDPYHGAVGEREVVELGAPGNPAPLVGLDVVLGGERGRRLVHLAVEVVADPLGCEVADHGGEDEQDRQRQPSGADGEPPAHRPDLWVSEAAQDGHA